MKNIVLRYGLTGGATVIILALLSMRFVSDHAAWGMVFGYAIMIISFSTIFIAVKKYRDTEGNGSISFKKAFQVGILVALMASAIYVAGWMVFSALYMPDFEEKYIQHAIQKLHEKHLAATETAVKEKELQHSLQMMKNPFFKIGMTFAEIFPVGLLMTLISAAVMRRKAKDADIIQADTSSAVGGSAS